MNLILSIKPKYFERIKSGEKVVEFRKVIFKNKVDNIYIYVTSPIKKIYGYFSIQDIISGSPEYIYELYKIKGSINEIEFFNYFKNKTIAHAILIYKLHLFENPINPYIFFDKFVPPQSFKYYDGKIH